MKKRNDSGNDLYLLDQGIEDRFFRAVLEYKELVKLVRPVIDEENFSTSVKARLWQAIRFFWDEFDSLPSRDLLEHTIGSMFDEDKAALVLRLLKRILKLPVPEWAWIIKRIDSYLRIIALQKSLYVSAKKLRDGNIIEAEEEIINTIRYSGVLQTNSKNDLDLSNADILDIAFNENAFCFPTRIYALDKRLRGIYRKELFLIIAPMNVGKSWSVIHLAVSALISQKYVLYFTLEMSRERVLQRILQNISGTYVPKFEMDMSKIIQVWDKDWLDKEEEEKRSLFNIKEVSKSMKLLKRYGGMLSVKEYPSGSATISDIEREMALFDVSFGKIPDVVIIDGLLDVKFSGSTDLSRQRLGLTQVAREMRRIASENNCAVITTHQANRQSIGAEVVESQHISESIGIAQVADVGISLNQTKAENELGKMRVNVIRARNEDKWYLVEVWQNFEIGQFCQVSQLVKKEGDDEEEDKPRRRRKSNNA